MAKYKQQKDGLFKTTISTGKYDENGKLQVINLSAPSSRKLEILAGEVRAQLKMNMYANDGGQTFEKYADHWFHTYPEKTVSDASKYKTVLKKHVDGIKYKKLSDITKSDIQQLINDAEGHPDVQRMIKLTVNQVLECAIEDGLIYKNVCRKIHVNRPQPSNVHRPLTEAEKKAISSLKKEGAFDDMEQLYIDTLYVSGIRPGEALALSYTDVVRCTIRISKDLTWKGGKHIKPPKTDAGFRTIDVPQWYQDEVNEYRAKYPDKPYLFTGKKGDCFSQSSYRRFWTGIYNKINIKMGGSPRVLFKGKAINEGIEVTDLTPYMFRHNYCTMLYYLKVDVKDAARLMGHADIRVTLEIYTHLDSLKSSTQDKVAQIAL